MNPVAVVVLICNLATLGADDGAHCDEVVITREASPFACALGEPAIAEWKNTHQLYGAYEWAVKEWRCERADYQPKRSA